MESSLIPFIVVVDRELAFLDAAKKFLQQEFVGYPILIDPGPIDAIHTAQTALTGKTIFIIGHDLGDMSGRKVIDVLKKNFRYSAYYILLIPKDDHTLAVEALDNDIEFFSKEGPCDEPLYNLGKLFKARIRYAERWINRESVDQLTGAYSRGQALEIWKKDFLQAKKSRSMTAFIYMDLNYFGLANKVRGEPYGDTLLEAFARCLFQSISSSDDIICRQGGDEFLVIILRANLSKTLKFIRQVEQLVSAVPIHALGRDMPMSVAMGYKLVTANKLHPYDAHETLKDAAKAAAENMRKNKRIMHAEIMRGPHGKLIRDMEQWLIEQETI